MRQDHEIIELFWARNEDAIIESDQKYGSFCRGIAMQILSSHEDACECVNDTWWRAWKTIPPERPRCLQAFFAKIVRNISFDFWRRQNAAKRGSGEMQLVLDELLQCVSDNNTPEKQMENAELGTCINAFLHTLPIRERNIFVRRYWLAESMKEIATRFQMKENAVRGSLFRSRQLLKAYLEKEEIYL